MKCRSWIVHLTKVTRRNCKRIICNGKNCRQNVYREPISRQRNGGERKELGKPQYAYHKWNNIRRSICVNILLNIPHTSSWITQTTIVYSHQSMTYSPSAHIQSFHFLLFVDFPYLILSLTLAWLCSCECATNGIVRYDISSRCTKVNRKSEVNVRKKNSIFDIFMSAYFNNSYEQICILWNWFRQILTHEILKHLFSACLLFVFAHWNSICTIMYERLIRICSELFVSRIASNFYWYLWRKNFNISMFK